MAVLEINGQRVEIDDAFKSLSPEEQQATVEEIARELNLGATSQLPEASPDMPVGMQARPGPGMSPDEMQAGMSEMSDMTQALGAGRSAMDPEDYDRGLRAALEARKVGEMMGDRPQMDPLGGWTDELYSNTVGAGARMLRDGVGYGEARKREQALQDELQARARKAHPVMSTVNDIAGGVMLGGTMAKGGLTLAGKSLPVIGRAGAAAIEGAGYGGLAGSGYAKQGEKLQGAATGAATGAITGGLLSKGGDMIANKIASRALAKSNPAPVVDDLAAQSNALYQKARAANVTIKPDSFKRVAQNMELAAGRINKDLRPNTAGIVADVKAMAGKPVSLDQLDELRQVVGQSMKRAQPQDVRTLTRMKQILDDFADNKVTPNDVTGDVRGFGYIKEARQIWARKSKTELVEEMLDLADVNSGKYSQSGMANAIRQKAEALYKQISKGSSKGWTAEEIALIRKMAKGGSNSQMVNWLAKFAPRGVVSAVGGGAVGNMLAGPAGMAVPAVGFLAGRAADKGAMSAATSLRDMAARGGAAILPKIQNRALPFIPSISIAEQGLLQQTLVPRK